VFGLGPQSIPGQLVRSFALQGKIRFTQHAVERMDERQVEADAVVCAIASGREIEVQPATDADPDIRVLFQEAGGISFYVVTICRNMTCLVVSVCLTQEESWEVVQGVLRRRSR